MDLEISIEGEHGDVAIEVSPELASMMAIAVDENELAQLGRRLGVDVQLLQSVSQPSEEPTRLALADVKTTARALLDGIRARPAVLNEIEPHFADSDYITRQMNGDLQILLNSLDALGDSSWVAFRGDAT